MRRLCAALLALGLTTVAPAAHAASAPNIFGQGGLLVAPSADVVSDQNAVGAHVHQFDDLGLYGIHAAFAGRLELSGTYLNFDNAPGLDDEFIFNAKFALLKESLIIPGFAVGVVDAFDELGGDPSWYVVASKGFPKILPVIGGLKAHFGYGGGTVYNDRIFAGLEWRIGTPLDVLPVAKPAFSIVADWVDKDVNLGLRGQFRGLSGTIGFLNDFNDFGGGVTYTWGFGR